jgi:hypothetical protein
LGRATDIYVVHPGRFDPAGKRCRALLRALIPKARPIVEALQGQGIRLSPVLIEAALGEVGE